MSAQSDAESCQFDQGEVVGCEFVDGGPFPFAEPLVL
jgi:hypothetical protein